MFNILHLFVKVNVAAKVDSLLHREPVVLSNTYGERPVVVIVKYRRLYGKVRCVHVTYFSRVIFLSKIVEPNINRGSKL